MFPKSKLRNTEVLNRVENLRNKAELHSEMIKYMFSTNCGALYPLDFLAFATVNRSLNLLVPFCDLISEKNIIASAALIRMQLDNVLRFYAAFLVDDPHKFAMEVMEGKHVRNMKDRNGQKMTDKYLHTQLAIAEDDEWITSVYNTTSGYIHFSERHIFNTFEVNNKESGGFQAKLTYGEHNSKDNDFLEAIEAFDAITELLFKYLYGWCYTKANPEIVEKARTEMMNCEKI